MLLMRCITHEEAARDGRLTLLESRTTCYSRFTQSMAHCFRGKLRFVHAAIAGSLTGLRAPRPQACTLLGFVIPPPYLLRTPHTATPSNEL